MHTRTWPLAICAVALLACAAPGSARAEASAADAKLQKLFTPKGSSFFSFSYENAPVGDLKKFFRLTYNERRERVLEQVDQTVPLLYIAPDLSINLLWNKRRERFPVQANQWADLAAISHAALSVHLLLSDRLDQGLAPLVVSRLELLAGLCVKARASLSRSSWAPAVVASQSRLLHTVENFARQVAHRGRASPRELKGFVARVRADSSAGIVASGSQLIDQLYAATMRARRRLTASEWRKVRVLIHSSPAPRAESALTLFFAAALGTGIQPQNALLPGESQRIVYAEEAPTGESGARLTLGTALVDETFSEDYFGDVLYMRRDATRSGTYAKLAQMTRQLPIP